MPEPLQSLLSSDGFMPHGHCYLWNPQLIALRHGGRVWASSAVGSGATFYFTLSSPAGTGDSP